MRITDTHRPDGKRVVMTEMTVQEYARAFDLPVKSNAESAHYAKNAEGFATHWTGDIKSHAQARAYLETGWSAGAARLGDMVRAVDVSAARCRRRVGRWSDDGQDLDVDRAMRGDDRSWRMTTRQWSAGPMVVDLIGFFGGNCGRSAEAMFWSGATCVVLADLLEQAGYGVRLLACNLVHSNVNAGQSLVTIVLKEESEPVRIDALASVMCHAGTYRTHGFHVTCHQPLELGWGLGQNIGDWDDNRDPSATLATFGLGEAAIKVSQAESLPACKAEIERVLKSLVH